MSSGAERREAAPWRRSAGSWRASIQDLSQLFCPPRFPRLAPPAGGKMASGPPPCRPLRIALPQVERWPAPIQTGKPRQVPSENRNQLYGRPAPQTRMAGTDCRLKRRLSRKGIAAWKIFFFSYCRAASARWWPASRSCCGHCWPCTDVTGEAARRHKGNNIAPRLEVTHMP